MEPSKFKSLTRNTRNRKMKPNTEIILCSLSSIFINPATLIFSEFYFKCDALNTFRIGTIPILFLSTVLIPNALSVPIPPARVNSAFRFAPPLFVRLVSNLQCPRRGHCKLENFSGGTYIIALTVLPPTKGHKSKLNCIIKLLTVLLIYVRLVIAIVYNVLLCKIS